MPRLFAAIRPPALVRAHLATIQHSVEGARWQDDDQLHLTLRFIGDVDARTGDDIVDALSTIHATGFDLALSGVGSFDDRGRIDAVWAGISPHDAVTALHKKIDHVLVRIGLPPEGRTYRPHITLARGRRMGPADAFVTANAGLASAPFPVTHFALYESTLGRDGANYAVVERWPLR